jgi:hypothetical protein
MITYTFLSIIVITLNYYFFFQILAYLYSGFAEDMMKYLSGLHPTSWACKITDQSSVPIIQESGVCYMALPPISEGHIS